MARWSFEPILESYAVVVTLACLLLALVILIQPALSGLMSRRRLVLALLRATLILLLVVAMLRPARVSTQSRPQSAVLLIMFDESRSMLVEDSPRNGSRWSEQVSTLREARDPLDKLSSKLDIRAYSFAEKVRPAELSAGDLQFPNRPRGSQTDIGTSIDAVLKREAGNRLAGVILLTDGAQRVYDPKVDLQQAARDLARLDCPLYTVAFGKPREQSQARDVAIENMRDQYVVFVKNELMLKGSLRVQGYVNRPIPVRVSVLKPNGDQETLGPIELMAPQDGSLTPFQFRYSPQAPGNYRMSVEVEAQPGELVVDNNNLTAYVTALDGGLRVLYLDGQLLGPEQQIVRRSVAASPDIHLDARSVNPRGKTNWPIDLSPEFDQNQYDIYLIGDVDAAALGESNLKRIAEEVNRGKGLMMLGGLNTFGPGGYHGTPLDGILPIGLGRLEKQEFGHDAMVRQDRHIAGPLKMLPTQPHFITHLADDRLNLERWRKLKPLTGANRFESVNPRATILAKSDRGDPLLVAWQLGEGRVIVFAGDTTHLWWRHGQQDEHRRFWRQSMLWLGNKDELVRRDVWIRLQRRRYRPGEPVELVAGARSETGDPLTDVTLFADLVSAAGDQQPLRLTRSGDEWNGSYRDVLNAGEYKIDVRAESDGELVGKTSVQFLIQDRDLELSDPAASPDQLQRMALTTRDSGGRTVLPEELSALLREIERQPPKMEIDVESKWRFGDTGWDVWPFFLVFVTVLGVEWWLRKKWGLV